MSENEKPGGTVPQAVIITGKLILPNWPRGMPLAMAAQYCGVGPATLTSQGPKPTRIGIKRLVRLREDLDAWLDRLAGKADPSNPQANPWLTRDAALVSDCDKAPPPGTAPKGRGR